MFAWYYTAVALLAVAVQVVLGRLVMERGGIARTIASLPLFVAIGGAGALLVPGLASAMALRGGEVVVRSGLYRGGWELLFAPLPPAEKRAAKPLMDVGVVRLGDVLGAAGVQVLAGFAAAVLGIIALVSTEPLGLTLVGFLVAGAAMTLSASALSGKMLQSLQRIGAARQAGTRL